MPIPTKKEIEKIRKQIRRYLNLKRDWKVEVEVRPYLGYDVGYEIRGKKIKILIYSVNYPMNWNKYGKEVLDEIYAHINLNKIKKGKIKIHEDYKTTPKFIQIRCQVHPYANEWLDIEHFGKNMVRISTKGSILIDLDKLIEILKEFKKKLVVHSL